MNLTSSFANPITRPSPFFPSSKLSMERSEEEEENDFLYNSLCSLSDPQKKLRKQVRKHRLSTSPVDYQNENQNKNLTCILNECFTTDGEAPMVGVCDEHLNTKKTLYNKTIKSIGTSLKNCDLSDMISIDIEADSTYLPLMCKLMIIVEGAVYERGKRLLLKDAAIQVGDGDLQALEDNAIEIEQEIAKDIPISYEGSSQRLVRNHITDENTLMKIRSNENINYEKYNEQMDKISNHRRHVRSDFDNHTFGGSLTNLASSNSALRQNTSNYFKKRFEDLDHEIYEYMTTPFYQYQRKNLDKIDFTNGIQEEFLITTKRCTQKRAQSFQETVEVHIPIQLQIPEELQLVPMQLSADMDDSNERYRNEKRIMINDTNLFQNTNKSFYDGENDRFVISGFRNFEPTNDPFTNQLEHFRLLSHNMRKYFNQRMNRFETEIHFFNDNPHHFEHSNSCCDPQIIEVEHFEPESHQIHVDHNAGGMNCMSCSVVHNVQVSGGKNLQNIHGVQNVRMSDSSGKRKSSVTNLMYMRVVDGNIITSV